MLKVRPQERDQYYHLSLSSTQQLVKPRVIDDGLHALQTDENLLTDSSTSSSPNASTTTLRTAALR